MPYASAAAPALSERNLRDPAYAKHWQSWPYSFYPPQVSQRNSQRDAWEAMGTGDSHAWGPAERDGALGPYSGQEARKVVHREIALGIKVGTDAEKTTVPFEDFLTRGKAFQKALRPHVPAAGLPYGKGFRCRLALAAQSEDVQAAMRALLAEKLSDAVKLEGIPARAQAAILAWFLG